MTPGEFIGTLLLAVTKAHEIHLAQKGPGSYARHMALGDLYEGLQGPVDELAECYQGLHGIIDGYPESAPFPDEPVEFAQNLGLFLEENREAVGKESFLQNIVDEIQALVVRAIYKLENLA